MVGCLVFSITQAAFSQNKLTRDNYTGNWENPASWNPVWGIPVTENIDLSIIINGFITCNKSIGFSNTSPALIINDTLVINGNLTLGNQTSLTINTKGILIVTGDLISGVNTKIINNSGSYIIVEGSFIKSSYEAGLFKSNSTPVNVYFGGSVMPAGDKDAFSVLACPGNTPYLNSGCGYGNMLDLVNDPVFTFFQTILTKATPVISASGPLVFCYGGSVTLTTGEASAYLWSDGAKTQSIVVAESGSYTVTTTDYLGRQSTSPAVTVVVNALPVASIAITDNSGSTDNDGVICHGATATLTATGGTKYSWSTGETSSEINAGITGSYTVTVTDANGCRDSENRSITVIQATADAGSDAETCGPNYTLSASPAAGTGAWSLISGAGEATFTPDESDPSATVTVTTSGSYQFRWTVSIENCPAGMDDISLVFHDIPVADAGYDQELNNAFTSQMGAELSGLETGVWSVVSGSGIFTEASSPFATVSGLSKGENLFLWTVNTEYCSDSDSVVIKVNDLFVPQAVTPNGDMKNDFFVIDDIEKTGPVELVIFNRWGIEVYSNANYLNEWDGKDNSGNELSEDTYLYSLRFAQGRIIKGYVVIKR